VDRHPVTRIAPRSRSGCYTWKMHEKIVVTRPASPRLSTRACRSEDPRRPIGVFMFPAQQALADHLACVLSEFMFGSEES
jgi:hypothetical protein